MSDKRKNLLTGRRYKSVEAMMRGEKFPKGIIQRVRNLVRRDVIIYNEFMGGSSIKRLARRHAIPAEGIEDIIRVEKLCRKATKERP